MKHQWGRFVRSTKTKVKLIKVEKPNYNNFWITKFIWKWTRNLAHLLKKIRNFLYLPKTRNI